MKKSPSIDSYQPDPENANRGTERGRDMLERSLRRHGAGRSIVVDRNGVTIAGNKTLEIAAELGLEVIEVETDGHALVVVKRKDLDLLHDPAARELAYADNRVGQVDLDFDLGRILQDAKDGVDLSELWTEGELETMLAIEDTSRATKPSALPLDPPALAWVLVGVPIGQFGKLATLVEAAALIPGSVVESSVSDEREQED